MDTERHRKSGSKPELSWKAHAGAKRGGTADLLQACGTHWPPMAADPDPEDHNAALSIQRSDLQNSEQKVRNEGTKEKGQISFAFKCSLSEWLFFHPNTTSSSSNPRKVSSKMSLKKKNHQCMGLGQEHSPWVCNPLVSVVQCAQNLLQNWSALLTNGRHGVDARTKKLRSF